MKAKDHPSSGGKETSGVGAGEVTAGEVEATGKEETTKAASKSRKLRATQDMVHTDGDGNTVTVHVGDEVDSDNIFVSLHPTMFEPA